MKNTVNMYFFRGKMKISMKEKNERRIGGKDKNIKNDILTILMTP